MFLIFLISNSFFSLMMTLTIGKMLDFVLKEGDENGAWSVQLFKDSKRPRELM